MAEQEASVADVTADVSDEQFDKYFESGGEEGVEETKGEQEAKQTNQNANENQSQVEEQKTKKDDRYVPYDALHEERMRRKEIQQELQQQREVFNRWMERVNQQQVQQNQPKPPSFEEDPLAALRYENSIIKQHLQQEHLSKQQREQYEQQQEQLFQRQQQFVSRYQNDAIEYSQTKAPDFKEAYDFLNKSYLKELMESGFSREEANRLLIENETAIVGKAYQAGMNPAERMYNLAKMRGYQSASKSSSEQKLDQLEKGVKASRSLNAPGGKSDSVPVTLEQLSHLSDDELDDFVRDPKKWDKLMSANR